MRFAPTHCGPDGELIAILYVAKMAHSGRRIAVYRDASPVNVWAMAYHEFLATYALIDPPPPLPKPLTRRTLRKMGALP